MTRPRSSLVLKAQIPDTLTEQARIRALHRLHLRWEAVDSAIRSLESYQRLASQPASPVPVNAGRTCW